MDAKSVRNSDLQMTSIAGGLKRGFTTLMRSSSKMSSSSTDKKGSQELAKINMNKGRSISTRNKPKVGVN
jgi:hypothetical protein